MVFVRDLDAPMGAREYAREYRKWRRPSKWLGQSWKRYRAKKRNQKQVLMDEYRKWHKQRNWRQKTSARFKHGIQHVRRYRHRMATLGSMTSGRVVLPSDVRRKIYGIFRKKSS